MCQSVSPLCSICKVTVAHNYTFVIYDLVLSKFGDEAITQ